MTKLNLAQLLAAILLIPTMSWAKNIFTLPSDGQLLYDLTPIPCFGPNAYFSKDDKNLFIPCSKGVKVFNIGSGRFDLNMPLGNGMALTAIAMSDDQERLALAQKVISQTETPYAIPYIQILNPANGTDLYEITYPIHGTVSSISFSPDAKELAIASEHYIGFVDAKTNLEINRYFAPEFLGTNSFWKVEYSHDGTKILAMSEDGISVFDRFTLQLLWKAKPDQLWFRGFSVSKNNNQVILFGRANEAYIYQLDTGKKLFSLAGHTDEIRDAKFSSNGQFIVTASNDRTIKVWNATTGKYQFDLNHNYNSTWFESVAISNNDELVVTADGSGTKIWKLLFK